MNRNLDLLRSLAVSAVLLAHIVLTLRPGGPKAAIVGRLGVLLFFVHTTLVLMQSLERNGKQRGWRWRFYVRRVFRIYPLAVVCLGMVLALRIPPFPGVPMTHYGRGQITANFLLIQNVWPGPSILAPMWSLPYELQMYLLLPVIFGLLSAPSKGRWIRVAAMVVGSIALASVRLDRRINPELFQFFPCFMGGVIAWQGYKVSGFCGRIRGSVFPFVLALFGLLYTTLAIWGDHLVYQWGVCLLLGGVLPQFRQIEQDWIAKPAALVAKYSYGIYLAHAPLLWFSFAAITVPFGVRWMIFAVSMAGVPYLLFHSVEKPMMEAGVKLTSVKREQGEIEREEARIARTW